MTGTKEHCQRKKTQEIDPPLRVMYVVAGCVWWDCGVTYLHIEDILNNKGVIFYIIRDIRGIKAAFSDVCSLKYVLNSSIFGQQSLVKSVFWYPRPLYPITTENSLTPWLHDGGPASFVLNATFIFRKSEQITE